MSFTRIVTCLLFALIANSACADVYVESFAWHAADVRGGEKAVLVLCPGMNQDGAFFLGESPWLDFAQSNDFGVIALAYKSKVGGMYGESRQGYYWPEQGSGEALLTAIRQTYGEDLPIMIYGFSGGAHFASRFAEWAPQRVIAWAAYSAQFWDSPQINEINPPGIVACGEHDGARWQPSFAYFYEGRQQNKPWVWVSLPETGHHRHGAFEQFVRDFFYGVKQGPGGSAFADVASGERFENSDDSIQSELMAIFPNDNLVQAWRAVHAF
jgi:pimeloyl-ACP methyl ester carboxylesterase